MLKIVPVPVLGNAIAGYKANSAGTSCEAAEKVTRFLVENLVSHPDGSSPKGINTRSLSLDIAATGVAHWLVTHDSGFNPKSITDPAPTLQAQVGPQGIPQASKTTPCQIVWWKVT